MGYAFKNVYGVLAIRDEATANEPKEIRFVDTHYNERFRIPDGEQILIRYADGKKKSCECNFIDEYHVLIAKTPYHICEFAEIMERIGAVALPFPEKRIIWQNTDLDLKDWEGLREDYPDYTDEELTDEMIELNYQYLDDERSNLKIQCGTDILVIGDIGRWNGRFKGYKIIESGKISDCLYSECDMVEWYVDREGEFRSTEHHHDGTNYLYYRKFKNGIKDIQKELLLERIYFGKATQKDIDRYTDKLGEIIGNVYGWEFPTKPKERDMDREER